MYWSKARVSIRVASAGRPLHGEGDWSRLDGYALLGNGLGGFTPDHPVLFRRHDRAYFINSAGMRALRFEKGMENVLFLIYQ